ncbi:MAG: isoleucine--tRNA ligase [Chloroflexota bacterium]
MGFQPVSSRVDIVRLEEDQLVFWRENKIFERTLTEREGAPNYVFYEGPPTANGKPGIHHVLARAFKDIFPRFKVMNGFRVLRKGGWDTHGLPVEIEVEKELGIKHKQEIEEYGIAAYNAKCRESVLRYVNEWERQTERMGFWVSLEDAYITFKNEYIQSVWWILKQFWEKELLYQDYKSVPYCPRCETPLSTHEMSDAYKDVDDPSAYVRFRSVDEPGVSFVAWTTTPWTLPGNVALAVGKDIDYVLVEGPAQYGPEGAIEQLIVAEALISKVFKNPEQYTVVRRMKGADLLGKHYEPLYKFLPVDKDYAYVVDGSSFVSTDDGTGIVHIAPAFGQDDMEVGRNNNLPLLMTVKPDGTFVDAVTTWAGMNVKKADHPVIKDLEARQLLFRWENYRHSYPHCWRCDTPLLYYARETWYIRTTQYRDLLLKLNSTINWVPEHIKDGRFGSWLANNRDWSLGRERYWGTPLPVWICDNCRHKECIGGVAELTEKTGKDQTELDLHRPYVDDVTWACTECHAGTMRRVPELIDVWFDSGSMPVAQWGYPYKNHEIFKEQFPADYICEAIDQTRGWFYSLHAISTLLYESVSYKNVICLGHLLDEKGRKMSKRLGNIVDPWTIMNEQGADATRWYMYTANPPGDSRKFSGKLVSEVISSFYLMLWNTYSFFVTYANIDGFDPTQPAVPVAERDELDRWALAELHNLVRKVTEAYEQYDVTQATRPVQAFVEDLSNWYLRRSRRRFWKTESDRDKLAAYQTLYECLTTVAKLLAPAMPFLSEALYRNLVTPFDSTAPDSIHLSRWPQYNPALIDQRLIDEMGLVKRLVSLGHAARNSVNLKVRQPLAEATFAVRTPAEAKALRALAYTVAEELNVKAVSVMESAGEMVHYSLNPLPQKLGKRLGQTFPTVQKMLRDGSEADVARWANQLLDGANIHLTVDDKSIELSPEEVEVRRNASEGYAVAEENGYVAALRTALTDALVMEGMAREAVRRVQMMRRDADFLLNDHIVVTYKASDKLAQAIAANADYLCAETLADSLNVAAEPEGERVETFEFDDETVTFGVSRI